MDGFGRIYQRGRTWWIQYNHRGKKHRETSKSTKRSVAVKLLKQRQVEMQSGGPVGADVEKTTFEDLSEMVVTDYIANGKRSIRTARSALKHLESFFSRARVVDIRADRLTAYVRYRRESDQEPANATIARELAILKHALSLGERAGKVRGRPLFPKVLVKNTRKGFFEEKDFRAVLRHLPEHLRPLVRFLRYTGWRVGEVVSLRWSQVDFRSGTIRLEPGSTKNDEGRVFPFCSFPALEDVLRQQRKHATTVGRELGRIVPWLFHRKGGKEIKSFRKAWRAACRKAGCPGRFVHDLRRTAVRDLERAGVPRSVATKLTGHKTEAVYRRYAIASENDLAEGVQKLSDFLGSRKRGSGAVRAQLRHN